MLNLDPLCDSESSDGLAEDWPAALAWPFIGRLVAERLGSALAFDTEA